MGIQQKPDGAAWERMKKEKRDNPASCAGKIHWTIGNNKRNRYKIPVPSYSPKLPKQIRTPCERDRNPRKNSSWQKRNRKQTTWRLSHGSIHRNEKLEGASTVEEAALIKRLIIVGLGTCAKARIRVALKINSEPRMLAR